MWKQKEEPKPTSVPASPAPASVLVETPSLSAQTPSYSSTSSDVVEQTQKEPRSMNEEMASIGKSIIINGKIELRDHTLTVGSNGRIKAQVSAKAIVVLGQVTGNLNATEKVDIKESGSVEGDIVAPRVAIADGSHFRGSIDMQKKDQDKGVGTFTKPESKTPKTESVPVNGEFARV